jgi:hypothetical protein
MPNKIPAPSVLQLDGESGIIAEEQPKRRRKGRKSMNRRKNGLLFQTRNGTSYLHNSLQQRWLMPGLQAMQINEKGLGFHAFRRFRKTWLRAVRCQEDINNFWMEHQSETMPAWSLSWPWIGASQKPRILALVLPLLLQKWLRVLQHFGTAGCRINAATLVESISRQGCARSSVG